jgi:hypothetical protein
VACPVLLLELLGCCTLLLKLLLARTDLASTSIQLQVPTRVDIMLLQFSYRDCAR